MDLFEELDSFQAKPGKKHTVTDFPTKIDVSFGKKEGVFLLDKNRFRLAELQDKLYAYDRWSVLVLFQAMDAAGKDGTIKHVFSGVNPQGCHVTSFKQPSTEELDHDYLWRIHKNAPERGRIGVFNRSHYEDVLVVKVHPELIATNKLPGVDRPGDIDPDFWNRRYRQINQFEQYLTENGTVILKFFLNVSEKEQEERFLSRLNDESKNWKFSASDLKERAYWKEYMKAYSDILTHTSTEYAPWYVIPADQKWVMRLIVSEVICRKMEQLDLRYPEVSEAAKASLEEARKTLVTDMEPDPAK